MVTTEGDKLGKVGLAVLTGHGSDGLEECRRLWKPGVIPPRDSQMISII